MDLFHRCATHFAHWRRLACVAPDGTRVSKEELSEWLFQSLEAEFVNRK